MPWPHGLFRGRSVRCRCQPGQISAVDRGKVVCLDACQDLASPQSSTQAQLIFALCSDQIVGSQIVGQILASRCFVTAGEAQHPNSPLEPCYYFELLGY